MIRTAILTAFALIGLSHSAHAQQAFIPEGQEGFYEQFRAAPAIRAGDFVHISGVVGYIRSDQERTPDAYESAIRDTFERVESVLNEAGTSWSDVVEMTSFHVDMRAHQEIFRSVREEFVTEHPYPAWTGIGVERLWSDALFVEIRVIAYVGEDE
ncbi:MAG: RidA family protein [Alphaproteobacteria bacterium]|nr:RidA family protein [Alphaproteobacteria bacterium]